MAAEGMPGLPKFGAWHLFRDGAGRRFRTSDGVEHALPLFLPVYHRRLAFVPVETWEERYGVEGCIVNAYFLYKDRRQREAFREGLRLREYVGLRGLLMTDSGAFQGFAQPLLLANADIVRFQELIGADVASPLDLVTPPGDGRAVAERKLEATLRRVREAQRLVSRSILAGVQQGGRFLDLRRRSIEALLNSDSDSGCGVRYVAIGSLVPFFNRNHDLKFVGQVLRQARDVAGADMPIHVFGAGDPVEVPFMVALGADIFDSSSYGHYARGRAYMTPYGALGDPGPLVAGEHACPCPACRECDPIAAIFDDAARLADHNLWTICETMRRVRSAAASGGLGQMLQDVLERHTRWFPESKLRESWDALHE